MFANNKYLAAFRIGFIGSLEYRTEFFMSILSTLFPIILQVFLWTAIHQSSPDSSIFGYSYSQIMLYTLLSGLLSKVVYTGVESSINGDINGGGLAKYLILPISYIPYRLSAALGGRAFFIGCTALLSLVVAYLFSIGNAVMFHPLALVLYLCAVLLAILLNFFLFTCVSTLCFWTSEAGQFFHSINVVAMVLSGGVFPLDVFGQGVAHVMRFLPFTYTIQFPIQILNGRIYGTEVWWGIFIQLCWILLFALLARSLWLRGLKKFVSIGG